MDIPRKWLSQAEPSVSHKRDHAERYRMVKIATNLMRKSNALVAALRALGDGCDSANPGGLNG
jgi:hypothetical protein